MLEYHFDALGTHFAFLVDAQHIPQATWKEIERRTTLFDRQFSRFIDDDASNQVHFSSAGTFHISEELCSFLAFAEKLKQKTEGAFDPAVAGLLDKAGYSNQYTFKSDDDIDQWHAPHWRLQEQTLILSEPTIFDIGAYGKGFWIDTLSHYLTDQGFPYHLVDGGGDMYGTEKKNGQAWNVAIEWPGKPEMAIGELQLKHQGLAVSDIFKRSWGSTKTSAVWHHVIDVRKSKPHKGTIGAAIVGPSAMIADGLSTALMLIEEQKRSMLAKEYAVEYLVCTDDMHIVQSKGWKGKFYGRNDSNRQT